MHMPEAELRAYLRIFIPEDRIEHVLDQVALGGLEIDAREEWQLFELAHREVARDKRVTVELEAAVLLEEVGLSSEDVDKILSLDVPPPDTDSSTSEPEVAEPEPVEPEPEPAGPEVAEPEPEPAGPDVAEPEPAEPEQMEPEPEQADVLPDERPQDGDTKGAGVQEASPAVRVHPSSPWRLITVAIVLTVLVVFLTVAVFTDAGQERLARMGLPPQVWIGVMVGLMAGGLAFLAAETAMGPRDTPVEDGEEENSTQ